MHRKLVLRSLVLCGFMLVLCRLMLMFCGFVFMLSSLVLMFYRSLIMGLADIRFRRRFPGRLLRFRLRFGFHVRDEVERPLRREFSL